MSNFNMKFIKHAISMYGLQNAQAIPNSKGNTCTKLLVNGETYKTSTLNKQACYDLVKKLADKQQNPDKYIDAENETTGNNQVQFTKDNENDFRDIEEEVTKNVSKLNNKIISTGGGVIKREINIKRLKQNATIVFIDRSLENLITTSSRPLSSNRTDLEKLYQQRYNLYKLSADIIVENNDKLEDTINKIINEVK